MDPVKEARRKIADLDPGRRNVFFFLPADFLYSFEALVAKHTEAWPAGQSRLFLFFFPDPEIFLSLLQLRNLAFLRPHLPSIRISVSGWSDFDWESLPFTEIKGVERIENHALKGLFPVETERVWGSYHHAVREWFRSGLTQFYFEKLWLKNALRNLLNPRPLLSFEALRRSHLGESCMVIAAGPSLYSTIPLFKKIRETTTLIACDTALRPLLLAGIEPHFVVALDGGFYNSLDYDRTPGPETVLLTDIAASPALLSRHSGPVFLFRRAAEGEGAESLDLRRAVTETFALGPAMPVLSTSGHIAQTALAVAREMGFANIGLAGIDLSYPFLESHAVSTCHSIYYHRRQDRFRTIPTQDFEILRHRVKMLVPSDAGNFNPAEPSMSEQAVYLKEWMSLHRDISFEIVKRFGQTMAGFSYFNEDAIGNGGVVSAKKSVSKVTPSDPGEILQPAARRTRGNEILAGLERISQLITATTQEQAASGDGFDAGLRAETEKIPFLREAMSFLLVASSRRKSDSPETKRLAFRRELEKQVAITSRVIRAALN
ncbi:MAG: DUF115 domain-containing protein [Spirochaetia bacterium]|nr:DUF115 domain-containing protein [Spirochaetia bacterium]